MILDILEKLYANNEIVHYKTDWQKACRENDERIEWHREKEYPEGLLGGIRPSEEPWQKLYRREVYRAIGSKTKPEIGRIETAVSRIQQSDDWQIRFNEDFKETGISPDKSIKKYLEEQVPVYGNLEDWLFGPAKTELIWGPNSFVLTIPELTYFKPDDFLELSGYESGQEAKPYPRIFDADDVVWVNANFAMFEYGKKMEDGQEVKLFVGVTKDEVALIERRTGDYTKNETGYKWSQTIYPYESGILPVFPIGHIIDEIEDEKRVYKSCISNGLANLNEVSRMTDDMNVMKTFHIHPKQWKINTEDCKTCSGTGFVLTTANEKKPCTSCGGYGGGSDRAVESPQNIISVSWRKLNQADENGNKPNIPFPPFGYIERPIEIFETYNKDIQNETYKFFCSNNIQFLAEEPLAESGKAKEIDKEEVHTFFYPIALQLAKLYEFCALSFFLQIKKAEIVNGLVNMEKAKNALPKITVPTEFNIATMAQVSESLALRIDKNFDGSLIEGGTIDLLKKQFGENSGEVKKYRVKKELDPLPYMNPDQKSMAYLDKSITQLAYVTSTNLDHYIELALEQEPNFYEMDKSQQKSLIGGFAKADMAEINKNLVNIPDVPIGG